MNNNLTLQQSLTLANELLNVVCTVKEGKSFRGLTLPEFQTYCAAIGTLSNMAIAFENSLQSQRAEPPALKMVEPLPECDEPEEPTCP